MRNSLLIIVIIILLSIFKLNAEVKFDFSGYAYDLPAVMFISEEVNSDDDDNILLINLARLRLKPELHLSEDARIVAHYELDVLAGEMVLNNLNAIGKTNRQAINLSRKFISEENISVSHYIDRLYFKHNFDWGSVAFGRQRVSWGVGRIWQPTDLFNPINPANFSKLEKDGADAITVKYYLGDFTDLDLVYNFREKWSEGNFGTRFRTNYKEYDISAIAGYFDKRLVLGADFAGNLFGAGFRGEGTFSASKNDLDSNFIRFILGLDYQLTSKLYALIEYQYNGEGTDDKSQYDKYFERLFKGEIQNVGKNYLAVSTNYQVHPLVKASANVIFNLNDKSGFINMIAIYDAYDYLDLSFGGMLCFGSKDSEYKQYPTALFLTGQYYF